MTSASFPRQVAMLLWKDVRVELRARELIYATMLFAAIIVLLFSFSFLGGAPPTVEVMAGVLWVAIALSGMLGISRSFEREREADTLRALLLAPIERSALYLAKLLSITLLMLVTSVIVVPGLLLFFQMKVGSAQSWLLFLALLGLGTFGFGAGDDDCLFAQASGDGADLFERTWSKDDAVGGCEFEVHDLGRVQGAGCKL